MIIIKKYIYQNLSEILTDQTNYRLTCIQKYDKTDFNPGYFIDRGLWELNKVIDLYLYYFKKDMYARDDYFDKRMKFLFCGLSYELLMKIILLKEDWDEYIQKYIAKNCNFTFGDAKKFILNKMSKLKEFNPDQYEFVSTFLTILQNQRNDYAHSPFAVWDNPILPSFEMIIFVFLLKYFDIDFENKAKLIKHIKRGDTRNEQFEFINDIGLYDYVLK